MEPAGTRATWMGKPRGRNVWKHMSQSPGGERVSIKKSSSVMSASVTSDEFEIRSQRSDIRHRTKTLRLDKVSRT